jgi:hypothetical protein
MKTRAMERTVAKSRVSEALPALFKFFFIKNPP